MFHLKLLINFLSLSIAGQIDWHALGRNSQGRLVLRWSQADLQPYSIKQILPACCVLDASTRFCADTYQVSKGNKKEKKGKGKADNNKYAIVSFNYSSISMTNHDRRSFINVPAGKLPHFNFAKWKHLMRAYLIGLHPAFGRLFAMDLSHQLIQEPNTKRDENHSPQWSSYKCVA